MPIPRMELSALLDRTNEETVTQPLPLHPGEVLRRLMTQMNLSANTLTEALGLPTEQVLAILEGRQEIDTETANRLSRHFGIEPEFWHTRHTQVQNGTEPHVKLGSTPSTGNTVSGRHKDKKERISEALNDLQLAISGLGAQKGQISPQALSSFARICSVFLRKLVLGDRGDSKTRLLDDAELASLAIRFQPIRKIPRDRRRTIHTGIGVSDGFMQLTKIDEPGPTLPTYRLPFAAQDVRFEIVWPLPGVADWNRIPTQEAPWHMDAGQLFNTGSGRSLRCDKWLGQQVVIFDNRPVSLKEIIRNIATFEGAHAIDAAGVTNLQTRKSSKSKSRDPMQFLNSITLFGIPFPHIIVMETALFLYENLLQEPSIAPPEGEVWSAKPGFTCNSEQALSSTPEWLQFDGSMTMVFSSKPRSARHRIKPVG